MLPDERGDMGIIRDWLHRNDVFYERGDPDVVRVSAPGAVRTPQGYGALMSVDYAACVQTKARSMASLPATVIVERRGGRGWPTTRCRGCSTAWPTRR